MATFLICHGAWSAGWAWKKVRPLLSAAGHEVFTPTYTGLGERAHQANPTVDLETHIKDVLAVIEFEDLKDIVLVGHSYGGMVATGVADRVPERVQQLIYLDAFVPDNGQSVVSLRSPTAPSAAASASREPRLAHPAQPDAARHVCGRPRLDHAAPAAAAHQDLHATAGIARAQTRKAPQLHLLHAQDRGTICSRNSPSGSNPIRNGATTSSMPATVPT